MAGLHASLRALEHARRSLAKGLAESGTAGHNHTAPPCSGGHNLWLGSAEEGNERQGPDAEEHASMAGHNHMGGSVEEHAFGVEGAQQEAGSLTADNNVRSERAVGSARRLAGREADMESNGSCGSYVRGTAAGDSGQQGCSTPGKMVQRGSGRLDGVCTVICQLDAVIAQHRCQVDRCAAVLTEAEQQAQRVCAECVRRSDVELETGGNVRYVEGTSSDNWYTAVMSLALQRFPPGDLARLGALAVKITRITKIINTAKRRRLEDVMGELEDAEDGTGLRLSHMFYCGSAPFALVAEDGFSAPACLVEQRVFTESAGPGTHPQKRQRFLIRTQSRRVSCPRYTAAGPRSAGLLRHECKHALCSAILLQRPSCSSQPLNGLLGKASGPGHAAEHSAADGLFRDHGGDPEQRLWTLFDGSRALPEYLLDFEADVGGPELPVSGLGAPGWLSAEAMHVIRPMGPFLGRRPAPAGALGPLW
eukprot:jgi/Botrbrau1/6193/Bobra.0344s0033.1